MSRDPWAFQRWAFETRTGNMGRKAVLAALAVMADKHTGRCEATQATIAKQVEADERSVRRYLSFLESAGFVARRHQYRTDGKRRSDQFLLLAPWVTEWPDGHPLPDTDAGSDPDSYRTPEPVATDPLPDNEDPDYRTENAGATGQGCPVKERPLKEPAIENDPPLAPPEDGGGGSEESAQQRFMQSFREPREGWERTANGRGRRQRASRRGGKPVPVPVAPPPDPEPVASLNGDAGAAQAEWDRVLDVVRQSVDAPVVAIWLDPLTVAGRGQDGALVLTGETAQVGWAIERFGRLLDAAAESVGVKVRIARHGATVSEVRPPGAG